MDADGAVTAYTDRSFFAGEHVTNLVLTGNGHIDATGNAKDNCITGNAGNNRLDGGLGADALEGGAGNDTYLVDHAGDRVIEAEGAGLDTVIASVFHQLADHVENLVLTGSADLHGTGNVLDNYLTGNAGNNVLDGGLGRDTLAGGLGDDTYIIDDLDDLVIEYADSGHDTVSSWVSYVLADHVEDLVLTGTSAAHGTGNGLNNRITGNAASNRLDGGKGNDVLDGGAGNDTLTGGEGRDILIGGAGRDQLTGGLDADHFTFRSAADTAPSATQRDVITDFDRAQSDRIDLSGIDANLHLAGDQGFRFLGTGSFSKKAGELRYEHSKNVTLVHGDTNGDGIAHFSIELSRKISLIADDFML